MTPSQTAYKNMLISAVKAGKLTPRKATRLFNKSTEHQLLALELAARANQKRREAILEEYNRENQEA